MEIDWFTFTAQIINFLILVWLLKRFLYGPILAAMERRERSIAERLQTAERLKAEAERHLAELQREREEWEAQKARLMQQARQQADQLRERLLEEIRAQLDQQRRRWLESLKREKDLLVRRLRGLVAQTVVQLADSILRELADVSLQDRMFEKLVQRWHELPEHERTRLRERLGRGDRPVVVRTAFPVDDAARQSWTRRLSEITGSASSIELVTDPELVCGLEVHANGYKLAWAFSDALQDVEERIATTLDGITAEPSGVAASAAPARGDATERAASGGRDDASVRQREEPKP